jgi:regulator of sigma E protease
LNLAVFNILPVPMLDGGYILFLAIEKIRGKPLSPKTQSRIKLIFGFLLLWVVALGVMNDIMHPLGK